MRCYFHLVRGSEVVRDAVGVEVADTEHLEAEIAQAIREVEGEDDPQRAIGAVGGSTS